MTSQLVGSSFTNGALLPNYVNGRLLAAEDLATGQSTLLQRDTWIGQAVGPGIVNGLWVTAADHVITVAAGLGISPSGEPVSLPAAVTLPLSIAGATAAPTGGSFATCARPRAGPSRPSAAARTCSPPCRRASCRARRRWPSRRAATPRWPAPPSGRWKGCSSRPFPCPSARRSTASPSPPTTSRNLLAHWCFGTAQLADLGVDPFNFITTYTGLDSLSTTDLTPCDLPLCVFYWDNGTITFLDNWSVRRRVTRPDVSASTWSAAVGDERAGEGEARFLQFQDQLVDLVTAGVSRATVATDVFGLLPPVGFLPVALDQTGNDINGLFGQADASAAAVQDKVAPGRDQTVIDPGYYRYDPIEILSPTVLQSLPSLLNGLGPQSGFVPSTFFGDLASFGGFLTWDMAYFALRQSYFFGPLATTSTGAADEAPLDRATPGGGRTGMVEENINQENINIARPNIFPYVIEHQAPAPQPSVAPPPPTTPAITYYFVSENFIAVVNALYGTGASVTPYLVFIKNQYWPSGTQAPFISTLQR